MLATYSDVNNGGGDGDWFYSVELMGVQCRRRRSLGVGVRIGGVGCKFLFLILLS